VATHFWNSSAPNNPWTFGPDVVGLNKEWDSLYTSAKEYLLHDAETFSPLEQIYSNPSHFAGWFLKKIEDNLLLHGSVPAEQNHSSVAADLGAGVGLLWSRYQSFCLGRHISLPSNNTKATKPLLHP
jgi:hypothetical protein